MTDWLDLYELAMVIIHIFMKTVVYVQCTKKNYWIDGPVYEICAHGKS